MGKCIAGNMSWQAATSPLSILTVHHGMTVWVLHEVDVTRRGRGELHSRAAVPR